MQIHSSSYYAVLIPDGHPVFARIAELDKQVVLYERLSERQKQSPKGKTLENMIRLTMRQCDVMLFDLFPELKAVDEQFDSLSPAEKAAYQEFAFELWEKISDRGYYTS